MGCAGVVAHRTRHTVNVAGRGTKSGFEAEVDEIALAKRTQMRNYAACVFSGQRNL